MEKSTNELKGKKKLLEQWFRLKYDLHRGRKALLFKEGEIWWCSLGENVGIEINGKHDLHERPVLIFKKYNQHLFLGIPLTSKHHVGDWYVEFRFQDKVDYAVLTQARAVSSKRLSRRMGQLTRGDFQRVKNGFRDLVL